MSEEPAIEVPNWVNAVGWLVEKSSDLWLRLGNFETRVLEFRLAEIEIDRPVFVSGLAQSGTTTLLELIAAHPDVATHQYRDFPVIYTPFWWNWFLDRARRTEMPPAERAHKDGIMVTPESPEAMEEVLWMKFFPRSHDPMVSNVLSAADENPEFEKPPRERPSA